MNPEWFRDKTTENYKISTKKENIMTPNTTGTRVDLAIIDEAGSIKEEDKTLVIEKAMEVSEKIAASFNPKTYYGKRTIGRRKMQLLGRLQMQANRLKQLGQNPEYALAKFTSWKGPIGTKTKDISGIISQLKALE